jgi:predicted RNA-binding Zn-ribbon protein involved in translation (DUF1610 family)
MLDIRKSFKDKPYVVCDSCGMQLFVRKDDGIAALNKISSGGSAASNASTEKLREKIRSLEKLVLRTCPECGAEFKIREGLIKTSWLDGRFQGFKCPKDGCKGIALRQSEEN